ncbi:MAG: carbohydrate-binding domain-containing protein [Clostridia bacterium]|nr:carbohydrate-binding domain-containing protein [Clostridia bacterium]
MKRIISIVTALLLLTGCSSTGNISVNNNAGTDAVTDKGTDSPAVSVDVTIAESDADMFSDRDRRTEYSQSECVTVKLNGTTAEASSDSVKISDGIITLTEEATYVISGTLDDGMIAVNAADTAKLQIVMDGADITSKTSAALYVLSGDKVFLTLAEGSQNSLTNGGEFVAIDDNNIDGALFSKQDLTVNGNGSLTVTSPAGHGIVCKDDLVFTGGTVSVSSASHGIDANDSVRITGDTSITAVAGKDGIHSENSDDATLGFVYVSGGDVKIEAEGDGIAAGSYVQIENGTFDIKAGGGSVNGSKESSDNYGGFMGGGKGGGGGRGTGGMGGMGGMMPGMNDTSSSADTTDESSTSMKGIKSANSIFIKGGTVTVDSADDCIHADVSITVDGGTFDLKSGDDAVHAEDTLTVNNCNMTVGESYEGLEAQKIYVCGGTVVVNSSDDGLNASGGTDQSGTSGGRDGMFSGMQPGGGNMGGASNGVIEITGGNLTVYASGDGIDSNGTLTVSGGYTYVANPTSGDTSVIDSDSQPIITGGTFISAGSTTMMAQTFSTSSTQGVIACTTGSQTAGQTVTVTDQSGNELISYKTEYSTVLVIISSPDIVKGETYTLTVGSTSGTISAS